MRVIAILITYHLSFITSSAQTFTDRIQQQVTGEGTVTIHHDVVIDQLVNGTINTQPVQTSTPNKQTASTPSKPNKQTANTQNQTPTTNHQTPSTQHQTPVTQNQTPTTQQQTPTTQEDTPVKRYRTTGYRVQVFRGGNSKADRQKAEGAGNRIREAFPGHAVYVEFFSPEWTCRVGNFRDIEDARKMRDEIRRMGFETATIVRGKIIVSVPQ